MSPRLSCRSFAAFAAGFTAATTTAADRKQPVIGMDINVKTPDGICDAVFVHPAQGSRPGVLLWHDSPGLRPVIRELGSRAYRNPPRPERLGGVLSTAG